MGHRFICRFAVLIAILAACAPLSRGESGLPAIGENTAVVQPASPIQTSPASQTSSSQPSYNYRIKTKDTVHIQVYQEADLDTTARVDNDGNIAFPLLGTAKIGGQTVQEATATMESLLREYLVHPQVSLSIPVYTKEHFTILGEVNKPGTYDMPDESTVDLLEAIGMAGGYTKIANPSKILVKRTVDGKATVISIDGKKIVNLKRSGESIPPVLPGDIIIVGEAMF